MTRYDLADIINNFRHYDMDHRIVAADDFRKRLAARELQISSRDFRDCVKGLTVTIAEDRSNEVKRAACQALAELLVDTAVRRNDDQFNEIILTVVTWLWKPFANETESRRTQNLLDSAVSVISALTVKLRSEKASEGNAAIHAIIPRIVSAFVQSMMERDADERVIEAILSTSLDLLKCYNPNIGTEMGGTVPYYQTLETVGAILQERADTRTEQTLSQTLSCEKKETRLLIEVSQWVGTGVLISRMKTYETMMLNSSPNQRLFWLGCQGLSSMLKRFYFKIMQPPNIQTHRTCRSFLSRCITAATCLSDPVDIEQAETIVISLATLLVSVQGHADFSEQLLFAVLKEIETATEFSTAVAPGRYLTASEQPAMDEDDDWDIELAEDEDTGEGFNEYDQSQWRRCVCQLPALSHCVTALLRAKPAGREFAGRVICVLTPIIQSSSANQTLSTATARAFAEVLQAWFTEQPHNVALTSEEVTCLREVIAHLANDPDETFADIFVSLCIRTSLSPDVRQALDLESTLINGKQNKLLDQQKSGIIFSLLHSWASLTPLRQPEAFCQATETFLARCANLPPPFPHGEFQQILHTYTEVASACPSLALSEESPLNNEIDLWSAFIGALHIPTPPHVLQTVSRWAEKSREGRGTLDVALRSLSALTFCRVLIDQSAEAALEWCPESSSVSSITKPRVSLDLARKLREFVIANDSIRIDLVSAPLWIMPVIDKLDLNSPLSRWPLMFREVDTVPIDKEQFLWHLCSFMREHRPDETQQLLNNYHQVSSYLVACLILASANAPEVDPDIHLAQFLWGHHVDQAKLNQIGETLFPTLCNDPTNPKIAMVIRRLCLSSFAATPFFTAILSTCPKLLALIPTDAPLPSCLSQELRERAAAVLFTDKALDSNTLVRAASVLWAIDQNILAAMDKELLCMESPRSMDAPNVLRLRIALNGLERLIAQNSNSREKLVPIKQQLTRTLQLKLTQQIDFIPVSVSVQFCSWLCQFESATTFLVLLSECPFVEFAAMVKSDEAYVEKVELGGGVSKIFDSAIEIRRQGLACLSAVFGWLTAGGRRRALRDGCTKEEFERLQEWSVSKLDLIIDSILVGLGEEDDLLASIASQLLMRILQCEEHFCETLSLKVDQFLQLLKTCRIYFKQKEAKTKMGNTTQDRLKQIDELESCLSILVSNEV